MKRRHQRLLGVTGPLHGFGCRRCRAAAQMSANPQPYVACKHFNGSNNNVMIGQLSGAPTNYIYILLISIANHVTERNVITAWMMVTYEHILGHITFFYHMQNIFRCLGWMVDMHNQDFDTR